MNVVTRNNLIRRGITLVELLVVISIMMMLAAYALPKLKPMSENRRTREAARSLNIFFGRARNRAIETGRPCGVILRRMEAEPRTSTVMYLAEVPPPYCGGSMDAKVQMLASSGLIRARFVPAGSIEHTLVHRGDLIQINNQGHWYRINRMDPTSGIYDLQLDTPQGTLVPWPESWSDPLPYTIFRRPQQAIGMPLQLPRGTAIDLTASGTSTLPQLFSPIGTAPVIIMFSPNGSLDRCYWNNGSGTPTDPLFFLIGKPEQIGIGPEPDQTMEDDETRSNWQILTNLWVTVSPQTGLVTVTENHYALSYYADPSAANAIPLGINEARTYAKEAQSMGGR